VESQCVLVAGVLTFFEAVWHIIIISSSSSSRQYSQPLNKLFEATRTTFPIIWQSTALRYTALFYFVFFLLVSFCMYVMPISSDFSVHHYYFFQGRGGNACSPPHMFNVRNQSSRETKHLEEAENSSHSMSCTILKIIKSGLTGLALRWSKGCLYLRH
jgi:hypothetical protein